MKYNVGAYVAGVFKEMSVGNFAQGNLVRLECICVYLGRKCTCNVCYKVVGMSLHCLLSRVCNIVLSFLWRLFIA